MDDAKRHLQERVLPQLREMEGFKGFVALGSSQSGKLQGVAFWESEEALRATDERVVPIREGVVEEYEVFVNEAPSEGPLGAVTGTVGGVTDTVGGATQPVSGVTDTVSGATDNLLGGKEKKS
jgi:hypothetical protein